MKFSAIFSAVTMLVSGTSAVPSRGGHNWSPRGGWGSHIDYSKINWNSVDFSNSDFWRQADYSRVDWSAVDWPNVDFNEVNWSRVNYPKKGLAQWLSAQGIFSSTYTVLGTPGQVLSGAAPGPFTPTGGLAGAKAVFQYGIIASANTICYNIALTGFQGQYQSPVPANTATHIHQGAKGTTGPPRIVFPNPVPVNANLPLGKRTSIGCVIGPFTTGFVVNGVDTGVGFQVSQIEANPKGFYSDIHSSLALPGAVRGQL